MTPEEREARTAAYWKNALAGADPEHWEAILKKDIPMSAGRGNLLYGFTDDELARPCAVGRSASRGRRDT